MPMRNNILPYHDIRLKMAKSSLLSTLMLDWFRIFMLKNLSQRIMTVIMISNHFLREGFWSLLIFWDLINR